MSAAADVAPLEAFGEVQSMRWRLSPTTYATTCGRDLVFLDIARGEYACVAESSDRVRLEADGLIDVGDPSIAQRLQEAGLVLVAPAGAAMVRPGPPGLPCRDLSDTPRRSITACDIWDFACAYVAMTWRYRGRSFGDLIDYARRIGRQDPPPAARRLSRTLIDDVQRFQNLLPWAPFQGECLFRSMMLLLFLRRRDKAATWVFGVRTWPFGAHCWLQVDDVVLDDAAGRLVGYVPILAV